MVNFVGEKTLHVVIHFEGGGVKPINAHPKCDSGNLFHATHEISLSEITACPFGLDLYDA
jgi:hypothetical protein